MDEIDSTMQQMLSGGQLDGSGVETKAAEIELLVAHLAVWSNSRIKGVSA